MCVVPSKLFNKRQVNFVGSIPVWQQVITMLNEKTRCVCTYVRGRKRERDYGMNDLVATTCVFS